MAKVKKVLIVCGIQNRGYWEEMVVKIEQSIGAVTILPEAGALNEKDSAHYDLIVIDVIGVSDMDYLVKAMRKRNPKGKILIATSSPTWQEARNAFYIGATAYIRRQTNADEMIAAFQTWLAKPSVLTPHRDH